MLRSPIASADCCYRTTADNWLHKHKWQDLDYHTVTIMFALTGNRSRCYMPPVNVRLFKNLIQNYVQAVATRGRTAAQPTLGKVN